mgnify:CR=1 FL=1
MSAATIFKYVILVCVVAGVIVFGVPLLQLMQAGGSLSQLYHPNPIPNIQYPRFSPDESMIAFTRCSPCKIAVCSIATETSVVLSAQDGSTVSDATFDPKSNRIAFVHRKKSSNGNRDYQLAVSQLDGSGLTILTSSDTHKRFPAFSFDGRKILFEGKERCKKKPESYCAADLYEYDFITREEKRLTDLQALQAGPASFLPGNTKIALTAFGSVYPRHKTYADRIELQDAYGEQKIFISNVSEPDKLQHLITGTSTASSPKSLPSGKIAFLSRMNEYDQVKGNFVYDVFLWSPTGSRRLTNLSRYVREFGISNSAQLVAFVTESKEKPAKAELLLWNADSGSIQKLDCGRSVEERHLVP